MPRAKAMPPLPNPEAFTKYNVSIYRGLGYDDGRIAVELGLKTPEQYEELGLVYTPPQPQPERRQRAKKHDPAISASARIAQRLERMRLANAEFERRAARRLPITLSALATHVGADSGYFWYRYRVSRDPSVIALKKRVDVYNKSTGEG